MLAFLEEESLGIGSVQRPTHGPRLMALPRSQRAALLTGSSSRGLGDAFFVAVHSTSSSRMLADSRSGSS